MYISKQHKTYSGQQLEDAAKFYQSRLENEKSASRIRSYERQLNSIIKVMNDRLIASFNTQS